MTKLIKLYSAIDNLKNYLVTLKIETINGVFVIKLIEALIQEVELLIPKARNLNTAIANDQIQQAVVMIQKIKYNNR
jgi:hypothetical protein